MMNKRRFATHFIAATCLTLSAFAFAGGDHAHDHGAGTQATEETAIGKPGRASKVTRTIKVSMNDKMRFEPASIQVKQGETVRFVVRNAGQIKHEMNLGTEKEPLEHLEVMKKFPNMEHDEPNKVSIAPGQQGEIVWQFTKAGTVNFACLVPGHYEAGMKGKVQVSKK
ncbi:cupredoxin domain-containing protein [Aquabacterium parvum]|jgi:uncharacterized cupredoxin-like copper-binding protein|uniref:cupredoxin domain-containing protein n=1 Tax=Aquabacterium parvum TaxID=70584 RepID=UPI000AF0C733|nr:cupredoxin family protein [Aquabacterium parvum]